MKYAVFSDIHGSTEGWRAMLKHPVFHKTDKKICLGDVIEFNEDCIRFYEEVQQIADTIILGNHEAVLTGECNITVFNPKVHDDIRCTESFIENNYPEFLSTIKELPRQLIEQSIAFTHGSFNGSAPWNHIRYIEDLKEEAGYLPERINFEGHGHIPFIAWVEDGLWYYQRQIYDTTFHLKPDVSYIINAGSILGSREMRWLERTYLVFDSVELTINFYKV